MKKIYSIACALLSLFLLSSFTMAEGQLLPSRIDRPYYEYNMLTSPRVAEEDLSAIDSRRKVLNFSLGLREEYDDNIRLTSEDEISDTSTIVEPYLRLHWPHKTSSLSLSYSSNLLFYNDHNPDNRYTHIGDGLAEFNLTSYAAFNLWVHDVYTLFPRDLRLVDTTRRNAIEGNILEIRPSLKFNFQPAYFEAGYLYQRQDYVKQDQGVEWKRVGPNFSLGRAITPKWDIALLYQYIEQDYERNPDIVSTATDYHDNIAGLRLKYRPYDNLSGEIGYNRLWRNFESRNDVQENIWEGIITFILSSDVTMRATYLQSFLDDVSGDLYRHDVGEFRVEHRLGKRIELRYGLLAYKDSFEFSRRKYEAWGTNDAIKISILQRLSLLLQGVYERRTFLNVNDDKTVDHYYTLGAELDYIIEGRFSAFIRYSRFENIADSDESFAGDYSSNRYAAGVRFTY